MHLDMGRQLYFTQTGELLQYNDMQGKGRQYGIEEVGVAGTVAYLPFPVSYIGRDHLQFHLLVFPDFSSSILDIPVDGDGTLRIASISVAVLQQ